MGSKPSYSASPRGDPGQWMFLQVPILDWFREPNSGAGASLRFDRWGLWSSTQQEVSRINSQILPNFMFFHAFSTSFCWAYYLLRPSEKFRTQAWLMPICSVWFVQYNQWPFQEPKLEVPTIYKAYVREYPSKIWPYTVQYLHFRILKFPLI